MKPRPTCSVRRATLAFLLLAVLKASAQTVVTVPATANIYGAGFGTAPQPGGSGGGVLPTLVTLPAGATVVTFSNVTGTVSFNGSNFNGADGGTSLGANTQVSAFNSLSGINYAGRTVFLVGVFLDASTPSGMEPAALSYSDTTAGSPSHSPLLRQVFFVGDGLDASSALQSFAVPSGATRLYLGFADAWNESSVTGQPGWYFDNTGSLSLTVTAVPEPAGVALLGVGLLGLLAWRRRTSCRNPVRSHELG